MRNRHDVTGLDPACAAVAVLCMLALLVGLGVLVRALI
jgi:hypothetical protein